MTAQTVHAVATSPPIAVALLGRGVVGSAFLELLTTSSAADLRLVAICDSTQQAVDPFGLRPTHSLTEVRDDAAMLAALRATEARSRVIVDATASDEVASKHAEWLAAGFTVVTANKAAAGGSLQRWRRLDEAGRERYGDSATVGAGLPILSTLRRLKRCGDELVQLEGVFSGSLSWLFNSNDGEFSDRVRDARRRGFTEPDPRLDLSGTDVLRKLLILAREAGVELDEHDVAVRGLVPETHERLHVDEFLARLSELDAMVPGGPNLRFLARVSADGKASVGLERVDDDHPANSLRGTENVFALTTRRYREPLVIRGAGAGPVVTAQALLGDVLELSA